MQTKKVSISDIISDQQIMPRDHIDQDYVDDLIEDLDSNANFPPVDLFFDGKRYYAADGYHRIEAFKKAGRNEIEAVIHKGDKRAAIAFASGANACHGKRRTKKDKRKAVTNLLMDPGWRKWSDGKIAKHCSVSQPFVSKVRGELTQNGYESPTKRLGGDGRTTDTGNIGKESNSKDKKETGFVEIAVKKDDLPPKLTGKKEPDEKDDGSGSDDTQVPSSPIDYTTVLAEAHRIIKDLEAAIGDFKKSLPPKDNTEFLSEINFSDHLDRLRRSWKTFVVFW